MVNELSNGLNNGKRSEAVESNVGVRVEVRMCEVESGSMHITLSTRRYCLLFATCPEIYLKKSSSMHKTETGFLCSVCYQHLGPSVTFAVCGRLLCHLFPCYGHTCYYSCIIVFLIH